MEDESGSIVAEATPDFYVRKVSLIIYIIIGETKSVAPSTLRYNLQSEHWDHSSN